MSEDVVIFIVMVFSAVFLLVLGLVVPAFGEDRQNRKRLQKRLNAVSGVADQPALNSLLREKYLNELSPTERWLETLPFMAKIARIIEQAGHQFPSYRLVFLSILLAGVGFLVGWMVTRQLLFSIPVALVAALIPILKIYRDRIIRFQKFEEQLPEAIDLMRRALQAGHPFRESLHLVAEDMVDPIAKEFEITFADINYGNDVRRAMLGLLERMPTITVMALVTSVLVQKETGGNLAEILEQISNVIRGRFKFQRKVKTLSAEGRLSAWILCLVPFALVILLSVTTPDYLPVLVEDERGRKFIIYAFAGMLAGIWWVRKIIRISV